MSEFDDMKVPSNETMLTMRSPDGELFLDKARRIIEGIDDERTNEEKAQVLTGALVASFEQGAFTKRMNDTIN